MRTRGIFFVRISLVFVMLSRTRLAHARYAPRRDATKFAWNSRGTDGEDANSALIVRGYYNIYINRRTRRRSVRNATMLNDGNSSSRLSSGKRRRLHHADALRRCAFTAEKLTAVGLSRRPNRRPELLNATRLSSSIALHDVPGISVIQCNIARWHGI